MPSSNKLKSCGRKRPCWLDAHGELLYRAPIPDYQTFDHNRAYDLIAKAKSTKPIVRCKIQCLCDGIKVKKHSTFATQPPRRLYLYRDIQRFYSFADNPKIVILGCTDPERKSKQYEFFKLDAGVAKELCEIIDRAHKHALCILVHDENTPMKYYASQSSLAGDSEHANNQVDSHEQTIPKLEAHFSPVASNGDLVNEVENFIDEVEQAAKQVCEEREREDMEIIEETKCEAVNYQPSYNHVAESSPIPSHLRSDPLFERLCKNIDEDELWAVDLKYVESHPQRGNEITSIGSTYLFVAHHKRPEYKHNDRAMNGRDFLDKNKLENTAEVSFTTTYVNQ